MFFKDIHNVYSTYFLFVLFLIALDKKRDKKKRKKRIARAVFSWYGSVLKERLELVTSLDMFRPAKAEPPSHHWVPVRWLTFKTHSVLLIFHYKRLQLGWGRAKTLAQSLQAGAAASFILSGSINRIVKRFKAW